MPKVIETNNTVRDQNNLPKKKKLWAIVVGINNYQDEEITNLQFCDNDAVGLAQVLQKVATQELPTTGAYFDEVEIIVHSNSSELYSWSPIIPPQQDKILASLEILSQARPQDTVLFYFSGHGFYEESIKDTILCLEETSNNNLAGTGLLIKTLLDKIDNSSAKQQLVLLDACHSGGVASQLIDAILRGKKNNPRLYCITACDRDEKSFETSDYKHGIFTYYLLEGLKGKASYSLIKTDDLYHFIARKTQDYISDANELSNLVNGCHIDRFSSFKPQRLVAGDGEFILGVSSNLIEDNRSRGALVLDGFCPSETIVKISQKLAIQGRFAYQPYPNKSESLADSISALLNSSATTTALLYLKGRFETDEEGVWFVFADGIKISRDWLAEQLRDSPVPQQIIILDCHQTSEIDSQIEPLKQPDKFQCIVAASMENDWLSQKFLEIIEQHTQYGLTATNFIKTIQQAFSQLGIDSSSQRDCYRSESGILNLILERGQHLEGIIIDRNFCPYKSLEAFTRKDKDFFFGRESLIDEIINKLETRHFLLVMGASGSGKSSLVQAGVVPRLLNKGFSDSENACNIWILRPGKHPIRELAEVLSQQNLSSQLEGLCKALEQNKLSPKHLEGIVNLGIENLVTCLHQQLQATGILVINQFEELFTNSSDVEQRLFVQLILGAVQSMDGNLKIIVTLRSDFLSSCLEIPELREKVKDEPIFVPSYLTEAEYRQIITNPAKRVGLAVEPELVNVLVEEVVQEKGALPLLEFTLEQLWQNRVGGKLSLEVYQQRIGGIRQVLQDRADSVYQKLTSSQQECAEWIFTQLVRLGEGTEDTRRRRNLSELIVPKYPQKLIESTLDVLIKSRLIVMSNQHGDLINNRQKKGQTRGNSEAPEPVQLSLNSEVTVEIAHEILIRTWQQLREWLKNNREFCTWQERLNTRMQEWKENQGELLSKTRLKIAEEWRQKRGQELSSEQENFIKKSQQKQMKQWWLGRGIASVIIIISLWTGAEFYKQSCEVGERIGQDCFRFIITSGDSLLFVGITNHFLQDGVKNFSNNKFQDAEQDFAKAQNLAPDDPIPLIYYNNAKALKKGNPYKLAVVVPVDAHEEIARNILRGVAYAQEQFNKEREKSETPLLEIVIANDINNEDIAKEIAKRLIKENVLGIIGHRSSGSSLAALPIYEKRGISMVSPTSGSTKLDQSPVFFRTIASNEEFAKDFYEYAKEQCFNDNKDNYVWVIYDSDAEYSKNLKDKFDEKKSEGLEELKERFDEISLNDLSNKNLNELEIEIKEKIDDGVRCTILLPSTKTTFAAMFIVYAQNNLELPREQRMQFLSHNDETLVKKGDPLGEDLKIPIPILDQTILEEIQDRWKNNINWRTYTSYKATQYLIGGLKELDGKEPDKKNTTSKKREIVLQYLKDQKNSSDKDLESCLMDSKDIEDNQYDPSNCINIQESSKN